MSRVYEALAPEFCDPYWDAIVTEVRGILRSDCYRVEMLHDLICKCKLVRESENPYDHNAIRVMTCDNKKVGYLAKETAAELAPQMDSGVAYSITLKPETYSDEKWGSCQVLINAHLRDLKSRCLKSRDLKSIEDLSENVKERLRDIWKYTKWNKTLGYEEHIRHFINLCKKECRGELKNQDTLKGVFTEELADRMERELLEKYSRRQIKAEGNCRDAKEVQR